MPLELCTLSLICKMLFILATISLITALRPLAGPSSRKSWTALWSVLWPLCPLKDQSWSENEAHRLTFHNIWPIQRRFGSLNLALSFWSNIWPHRDKWFQSRQISTLYICKSIIFKSAFLKLLSMLLKMTSYFKYFKETHNNVTTN